MGFTCGVVEGGVGDVWYRAKLICNCNFGFLCLAVQLQVFNLQQQVGIAQNQRTVEVGGDL